MILKIQLYPESSLLFANGQIFGQEVDARKRASVFVLCPFSKRMGRLPEVLNC